MFETQGYCTQICNLFYTTIIFGFSCDALLYIYTRAILSFISPPTGFKLATFQFTGLPV